MAAPITHTVGSQVWLKNSDPNSEDVWIRGEVVRLEPNGTLVVRSETGQEVTDGPDAFPLQNLDSQGVEVCVSV